MFTSSVLSYNINPFFYDDRSLKISGHQPVAAESHAKPRFPHITSHSLSRAPSMAQFSNNMLPGTSMELGNQKSVFLGGENFKLPKISAQPSMAASNYLGEPSLESVSTIVNNIAADEDDWLNQMKVLEEVDELTAKAKMSIPQNLRSPIMSYIEKFPGLRRVIIFKLLSEFNWEYNLLSTVLSIMQHINLPTILPMMEFISGLIPQSLHKLALDLFGKLQSNGNIIHEFVVDTVLSEAHYLMQIARHLTSFDLQTMADNLLSLSVKEMLDMCHHVQAHYKHVQHCALCRQKRIYNLNFRLCQQNQIPPAYKDTAIPGTLELFHHPEIWAADDERMITFDSILGQIFWMKHPVNLVEICDDCLSHVHKAITNQGRHEPIHHIDADKRKPHIAALRKVEMTLADIVMKVAKERKYRRLREFALHAIKLQNEGLKREETKRQQQIEEERRQQVLLQKQQDYQILVNQALTVDNKWKHIDRSIDEKQLHMRINYALVQKHMGFSEKRPAPRERIHSRTWELNEYDEEGLPITASSAAQVFGQQQQQGSSSSPSSPMNKKNNNNDADSTLSVWKSIAEGNHALFKQRLRDKEAEEKRIAEENMKTMNEYIRERIAVLNRQQDQMKHLAEQEEIRRLNERKHAREMRRQKRFDEYLASERQHMLAADEWSHKHRAYLEEIQREDYEREGMFNAECDQREIDRFWGIDLYEAKLQEEEKRLRHFYQHRLISLNRELKVMGCIKGLVQTDIVPIGNLPEDNEFDDMKERRKFMIKKFKAEEVRSQTKIKTKTKFF